MSHVNIAEFARIKGVSEGAVRKAIKSGRLKKCLKLDAFNKPKIDPVAGLTEWDRNTDPLRAKQERTGAAIRPIPLPKPKPPPVEKVGVAEKPRPVLPPPLPMPPTRVEIPVSVGEVEDIPDIMESRAKSEAYKALLLQLEYDVEIKKVISAEEVKNQWVKIITNAKQKIIELPSKIKSNLHHITPADIGVLERLVRETLEEMMHDNNNG